MGRTIGRRWSEDSPLYDRQSRCDYCGTVWPLSKLTRDEAGLFYCPTEGDGRDTVALTRLQAEHARNYRPMTNVPSFGPAGYVVNTDFPPDIGTVIPGVSFGNKDFPF